MRTAVVVSILAHASLIGAAGLRKPSSDQAELAPPTDVWAGTTALPTGSEELVDVDTMGGSSPAPEAPAVPAPAPAAPSGNDSADEIPVEPEPAPAVPDKPAEPDKPKVQEPKKAPEAPKPKVEPPKAEKPAPKEEAAEDKAAEKKDPETKAAEPEVQAPADPDKPEEQDKPAIQPEKKPSRTAKRPKATPPPVAAAAADADGTADGTGKSASAGSFGAAGEATVRDLGKAFARALPAASSPDKAWGSLSAGSSGAIEVAVAIGEEGKITGFDVLSKDPPAFLIAAVKRTVDMLKFGAFMRPGETATAGRNVFKIVAEISDREVTEEDVSGAAAFGLGSTWEGRKGTAHFTQASGKHVEMKIEFVRALAAKE